MYVYIYTHHDQAREEREVRRHEQPVRRADRALEPRQPARRDVEDQHDLRIGHERVHATARHRCDDGRAARGPARLYVGAARASCCSKYPAT